MIKTITLSSICVVSAIFVAHTFKKEVRKEPFGIYTMEYEINKAGEKHGSFKMWNEKGDLIEDSYFQNNQKTRALIYDDDGRLKEIGYEDENYEFRRKIWNSDGSITRI